MKNQWVVKPRPNHNAEIKLLCFPYAGGGIHVFYPWKELLDSNIELNIVQLPGRGTHFSSAPIDDMAVLVESLLPKLADVLNGNYVVFGHSLGSRVAFELVRQAVARGFCAPKHFFASGSSSPVRKAASKILSDLPDDEFIAELEKMNGTPSDVLQSRELMSLMLPTLRADFKIAEQYRCEEQFVLPTAVTVLSGEQEEIARERLEGWGDFFTDFSLQMCPGDHFFIDSYPAQVVDVVNRHIAQK